MELNFHIYIGISYINIPYFLLFLLNKLNTNGQIKVRLFNFVHSRALTNRPIEIVPEGQAINRMENNVDLNRIDQGPFSQISLS